MRDFFVVSPLHVHLLSLDFVFFLEAQLKKEHIGTRIESASAKEAKLPFAFMIGFFAAS